MTVQALYNGIISNIYPVSLNIKSSNRNTFGKNDYVDKFEPSSDIVKAKMAEKINEAADNYSRNGMDAEAENYYKQAINTRQEFVPPYYGLAKVYKNSDRTRQAIETYENLLKFHPEELEAQTLMGLCYKNIGDLEKARETFQNVCDKDPKYDYAQRSLKATENAILSKSNPELAEKIKTEQSQETLNKALELVAKNTPKSILDKVKDVNYSFNKTDSLAGHPNIAQYEHSKRNIVITDEYRWAAPEIVAAYIEHENIHASDNDGYTSIHEEQDAYDSSIEFWGKNSNGVKDPELDYATTLYKQNPLKLRSKVAEVYRTRDSSIPEYSPNHKPPNASLKLGFFNSLIANFSSAIRNIF